jgi:serpin B
MRYLLLLFPLELLLVGASLMPAEQPKVEEVSVVKGNNEFALALFEQLRAKEGNLFFSPYSISDALAMTAAGARGETLEQMAKTLHLSADPAQVAPAFQKLIETLNGDPKFRTYQLSVANALWGQKGYHFLPEFLKQTETNFHAGLQQVDFAGDAEKARQTINQWVAEQTKDKIKALLQQGTVRADTRLVLTNAIYFKAAWESAFNEKATTKEDFLLPGGKKLTETPLMHQTQKLPYFEGDTFQMVEIPYQDYQLSFVALLPKKVDDLADLEKELTPANLGQWAAKRSTYLVDLTLPKFKVTAEFELAKTLSAMGMPLAFSDKADFSGMTRSESLMIGAVVHKAFVDVHEKGTEAAAATAVLMRPTSAAVQPSPPPRATVRIDHPFLFLIRDRATDSILFMGRVTDPSGH